ncbi:hypothetical protein, partial [Bacillus pumilus]|uniref:hypothetical protein n=1 Tax=Bacillus pumilus TaxID=1408 RepID=UPI0011A428CA
MIVIWSGSIIFEEDEWIGWVSGGMCIMGIMISGVVIGGWRRGDETRRGYDCERKEEGKWGVDRGF